MPIPNRQSLYSADYEKVTEKWRSKRVKKSLLSLDVLTGSILSPLEDSEKNPYNTENIRRPRFLVPEICSQADVARFFRLQPNSDSNFIPFFMVVAKRLPGTESIFGMRTYVASFNSCYRLREQYGTVTITCRHRSCAPIFLSSLMTYALCVVRRGDASMAIPR